MSSQDVDVDISVVSSPEPSPRPDDTRNDYYSHHQNHSIESRLSPPKSPPEHGKTSGSPYTSFSITSILSRAEPRKGPIVPLPTLASSDGTVGGPHDAAMISRWAFQIDYQIWFLSRLVQFRNIKVVKVIILIKWQRAERRRNPRSISNGYDAYSITTRTFARRQFNP